MRIHAERLCNGTPADVINQYLESVMSEPMFAAVLTTAFFGVLIAFVPFLEGVAHLAAFLVRRRMTAGMNLRALFAAAQS